MEMHFATLWEAIADAIPERTALVHGTTRRTWAEYDDRAARLASAFTAAGLGPDSKIGMYLYNGNEYLETQYAGFKMRAVPVNVNYRYLDDELWYLLDNADAEALVFHASLEDRVERVRGRLPKLKLLVEVDDLGTHHYAPNGGSAARFEDVIATHDPMPRITRDESDIYMLYTGGTTGMPKGVMYAMGGRTEGFVMRGFSLIGLAPPSDPADVPALVRDLARDGELPVSMPACPLMHGTGMWLGAMIPGLAGGTVVTLPGHSLDAHAVWKTTEVENVSVVVIVGDAFCKPMIHAFDEAAARSAPYDASSLKLVVSSGVMWTAEVKSELLHRVKHLMLIDAIGSTEGSVGVAVTMNGPPPPTAQFDIAPETKVFTEDGRSVQPGSGEAGMVAAGGNLPLGYFKDPKKSAGTFRVIDGVRYSFTGDWATIEADGSLTLLGRGSQCINSGGEKIFPEEVEEAVKRVDGIYDCLVVGVPDERFGERVTAVVSLVDGATVREADVLTECKATLAGYKAPKRVIFVTAVPRAPNGKADYRAAQQVALAHDRG